MRRSFSGPLLLLTIGALFLWRSLHPEAPIFDLVAQYWPFALIACSVALAIFTGGPMPWERFRARTTAGAGGSASRTGAMSRAEE